MKTLVTLAIGIVLGAALGYSFALARRRGLQRALHQTRSEPENCRALQLPARLAPSDTATVSALQFLYDKRLTLFNTRREHEWKIYFGAMVLLGAADAAIVTSQLTIDGWERIVWIMCCALVFTAVFGYESRLQVRNSSDRAAMDLLYDRVCEMLQIPAKDPSRERKTERKGLRWWSHYGWAFPWQILLLFAVAAVSAALPYVK